MELDTDLVLTGGVIVLVVFEVVAVIGIFLSFVCNGLNMGLAGNGFAVFELKVENIEGLTLDGVDAEETEIVGS